MKNNPPSPPCRAVRPARDRRIDLCYVIGILLVVAGHSGADERFASTALFRWIYAFHMPLFFALSGYLFRYGGGTRRIAAGTFVRRRARRLLVPLAVWTTLVFIPKGLLSAYAMRPSELSWAAYLHAFLYPADNPIRPYWFLEVLFEVSLAGYAVDRIVRGRPAALAAVAAACIAVNRLLAPTGGELLMLPDVLWYTGFFLLGAVACDVRAWLWPRLSRMSSLLVWGAASLATLRFPSHAAAPFYAVAGILFVASCAALAVDRRSRLPLADDLRRYTFTIYLLHVLPIGLLRGLLYPCLAVDPALFSVLLFLSGVIVPRAVGRAACRRLSLDTAAGRLSRLLLGL